MTEILFAGDVRLIEEEIASFGSEAKVEILKSKSRGEFAQDTQPGGRYANIKHIYSTYNSVIGPYDRTLILDILPPSVKSISSVGAGYDRLDVDAARERGIQISNSPVAVDDSTATNALYLLLGAARRFSTGELDARDGLWKSNAPTDAIDPEGKTLGIVGLGGIGRALARRALPFGIKILYHNRNPVDPKILEADGLSDAKYFKDLKELLGQSDIVSLHVPLNSQTKGFFDASHFAAMKDNSILVNTARGAIVDEVALIKALESGKLHSAGLDVFADEPNIPEELRKSRKVTILPHLGTNSNETLRKMKLRALENIKSAYRTGKVIDIVPELKDLVA